MAREYGKLYVTGYTIRRVDDMFAATASFKLAMLGTTEEQAVGEVKRRIVEEFPLFAQALAQKPKK